MHMTRYVGLYKELDDNEQVKAESRLIAPTVLLKEVQVKKFMGHERKQFPISYLLANVYLTNKRLMFLIFREIEALILQKKGVPNLVGLEGSWFEIPTSAIHNVEAIQKQLSKEKEIRSLIPSLARQETVSIVEIAYNANKASGKLKDYIESMFNEQGISKRFHLKNIEETSDVLQIVGEQTVSILPTLTELTKTRG